MEKFKIKEEERKDQHIVELKEFEEHISIIIDDISVAQIYYHKFKVWNSDLHNFGLTLEQH